MKSRMCIIVFTSMLFSAVFMSVAHGSDKPEVLSVTPGKIARGDTITITGKNLSKEDAKTIVKIDGKESQYVEVESAEKIKVLVNTDPNSEVTKRVGEYNRSVVVMVGEQQSAPYTFTQLTWDAIRQPHVTMVLILYLSVVFYIIFGVDASLFKSKTGQLSLSKIQMGLWTFVFGLAYIALAAIWRQFLDITEGMFWLMGISSATAVGAKAIVLKNKIDPKAPNPSTLLKDYDPNAATFKITDKSLEKLEPKIPNLVLGKLKSIKSDEEIVGEKEFLQILQATIGTTDTEKYKVLILKHTIAKSGYRLSLHRCQIALWTLIVLCIYVIKCKSTMHLPDIPNKLLVLMGVSGGTYLGFNYPVQK